jgi:AraC-like DNA-binding protein
MVEISEKYRLSDIDRMNSDLIVYHYGMEECKSGHSYGPALRDHFLIHFILSGSGRFRCCGKEYELQKNQGFLICPQDITYYEASENEPWAYMWIGFMGLKAESYLNQAGLSKNEPIFNCEGIFVERCFKEIFESDNYMHGFNLRLQGLLSIFLAELIEQSSGRAANADNYKKLYIKRSLQYIENNYSQSISVSSLAEHIGLNKNYFSTIFNEAIGLSPQQYIINFRINKACMLLENKNLSIGEVSRSVGYVDQLGFSKVFKQIKGKSPKHYRDS